MQEDLTLKRKYALLFPQVQSSTSKLTLPQIEAPKVGPPRCNDLTFMCTIADISTTQLQGEEERAANFVQAVCDQHFLCKKWKADMVPVCSVHTMRSISLQSASPFCLSGRGFLSWHQGMFPADTRLVSLLTNYSVALHSQSSLSSRPRSD
jgi:hypothetical protein